MCLAVPVKVKKVTGNSAIIENNKKVDISLIQDLKAGDYLLIHTGLAINKLKPKEAKEILKLAQSCPCQH